MNPTKMRSCLTKRPYISEAEAGGVVKAIKKQGTFKNFTKINAYKCLWCEFWHVGHNNLRRSR